MNIGSIGTDTYAPELKGRYDSEINKTESLLDTLRNANTIEDDKELLGACQEFESYFLNMMFKEMRKTVFEDKEGLFKKSNPEIIFREMFDEQMAVSAASGGGIGLAAFMYKQMKRENQILPESDALVDTL